MTMFVPAWDGENHLQPSISIETHRVADSSAPIAAFNEPLWPLDALPRTAGATRTQITFEGLQEPWGELARWLAHLWINYPTPAVLRDRPSSRFVDFPSPQTVRQRVGQLRHLVVWLGGQGVTAPAEIDDDHIIDYALSLRENGLTRQAQERRLESFTLWRALEPSLPDDLRLPADLRLEVGFPRRRRDGSDENKTRRVRQATMGPLLWWATRFIDDYSNVVLALADHVGMPLRVPDPTLGSSEQVRRVLDRYLQEGQPLPRLPEARDAVAQRYLAWLHGLAYNQLAQILSTHYAGRIPLDAVATCPIPGLDRPVPDGFEPFMQFYDAVSGELRWPRLVRALQTSCLIVITYLSGMRSDEVRRLKPGCCPAPVPIAGGGVRHLIYGTVTKRRAQEDGLRSGARAEEEAVWATVPLAARAITVMEQVRARYAPESDWLFNSPMSRGMLSTHIARTEIQAFIEYVNDKAKVGTYGAPTIPRDTHGPVTLRRFRRTLAWYIRNQPDGDLTLGLQYQHVGTVVGSGYAAAGSTGWSDLLDEEGLATRRRVTENLGTQMLSGAGISGPAAARATSIAAELSDSVSFLPDGEVRRLLRAPGMQIYDNKASLSLCIFDPTRAQCQATSRPNGAGTDPDLLGCRSGCANRAMTDAHAHHLGERAAQIRAQAGIAPPPMRNRLNQAADEMDERVAQHWQARIVPTVADEDEETA